MNAAARLRQLLQGPAAVIVPGAANALTARIAQECGFKAVFFTGAGFANMELGIPDLGLTTMSEVVQQVGRVTDAVDVPVIADADTGYGNPLNVRRTVRELERAGAAAIVLEDQSFPKRCGHFDGKDVIPVAEMIAKIEAAIDARRDPATMIVARTDAGAIFGIEDAIERAAAYVRAGAEATFVEAPRNVAEMTLIPKRLAVPQIVNVVEGGKTPQLPARDLETMGFKIILYANSALRAAVKGIQTVLRSLAERGATDEVLGHMASWDERQRLVDVQAFSDLERRYVTRER
jgi:2-methylisocitrate lyase-like PEP mutase family enzyme